MGSKTRAKAAMRAAGLDVIPGSDGVLASADDARRVAGATGFPVLFKAENGGGGRGMRIARSAAEVDTAYAEAQAEARVAFGGDRVYLEKLIEGGRHVEIQIFADRYGHAVHLGERDCTVQRNHQKLIEESPSPAIGDDLRARATAAAARAAARVGYVGAGTMELLLDGGVLRFMEMNCRLQVEHTVSEVRSGRDLVIAQIEIAAGRPLTWRQGRPRADRPRHRVPDQRRGSRQRLRAGARDDRGVAAADRRRDPGRQPRHRRLRRAAVLRLAARQGHRLRGRPRRGDRPDDRRAVGVRGRRRADHDPDAPGDLGEPGVPVRRLRHALDPGLAAGPLIAQASR